jgi:methyl-accepting chemotaxis protein
MPRQRNLGQKLTLFISAILVGAFLVGAVVINRVTQREVHDAATLAAEGIAKAVLDMVDVFSAQVARGTDRLMSALLLSIHEDFHRDASASLRIGERNTPLLRLGGRPVNLDFALVDRFTQETGGVATIFVRDGDDFVRISTSLKKEDGSRAIGTVLDHAHPAYAKIMAGETYRGAARLFGRDYFTKYVPIRDKNEVIGILFVGIDYTEELRALRERIKAMRVGQSGYVYVLDAREGPNFGHLLVHPEKEGESLLDARDADGRFFARDMLTQKQGLITYPWKNSGELFARDKVVAYGYNPVLGWLLASGAYVDDLGRSIKAVESVIAVLGLALLIGLPLVIALAIRRLVARPLGELQNYCQTVESSLDFTLPAPQNTDDEVGRTSRAVASLLATLRQTFAQLMQGAVTVDEAAHRLSQSARKTSEQSHLASESAASMAAAVEEMTVGISHISENANLATELATTAGERSREGGETILCATHEMRQIATEVGEASTVIAHLGDETGKISSIVSVIREVAEQTNLLALNAAIEAARAGESGRGFAVVADEVRKLAERTSASSGQISDMVSAIQTLSDQARRIMQQTAGQAEKGAVLAGQAGRAIQDIQEGAGKVLQVIQEISLALGEQSSASQQIAQQTEQVARIAEENNEAARESSRSAEQLEKLGEEMRTQVQRFRFA